jgi:hypothetical protein
MERPDHFVMTIISCRTRRRTAATIARVHSPSALIASVLSLLLLAAVPAHSQQSPTLDTDPAAAAGQIADFFSKVGDEIYEDCIFELSPEQIEVQQALIRAYIAKGASSIVARRLAVQQIHPPKLSDRCEQIRRLPKTIPPDALSPPPSTKKPQIAAIPRIPVPKSSPHVNLASKKVLPQWDCAPGVDYVTIQHKGFPRKLTGGEICNPFEDVVHEIPPSSQTFRLGYTISTGRLFIVSDNPQLHGKTIAWAISGREVCRNNPDPDCLAARAVGPLPPGEYAFSGDKAHRVTWGPTIKRNVVGVYLKKLWDRNRFSPQQTAAILARGNIAIHERLKGEMSEACLGLEPKGWAYVASLIKDGRATGLDVYIDEPYPQVAENPPIVVASSFSLTSLFK